MNLCRLSVQNYKSIPAKGLSVELRDSFLVLVGRNNAGKSNVIAALGCLFGTKNPRYLQFGPEAFNDASQPIVIEAELDGLDWGNGKQIGLSDAQCAMLTKATKKPGLNCGHVRLILSVPALTEQAAGDPDDDDSDEGASPKQTFCIFLGNIHEVKKNEDIRRALCKLIEVPPIRSTGDQLTPSTWTSYGRLLRTILADSPQTGNLVGLINNATERLRSILQDEADMLSATARTTAYIDSVSFQLTKDNNPAELLKNLTLTVEYGGRSEDISQSGTGTQSALIIGILELCLKHRSSRGIRVFVVEEPELYLHPHAQRQVAELLRALSAEANTTVIVTTHSPAILADSDIRNVVRIDRSVKGLSRCHALAPEFAGLESSERILTAETCEMLFADKVILVEGSSEKLLLPRLAKLVPWPSTKYTCSFDRANVSVVNVGGKDHLKTFSEILDCFSIEWRVIADRDALLGTSLLAYKKKVGLLGSEPADVQTKRLLGAGVVVLSQGEIEDYYPPSAIATIAGCAPDEVQVQIEQHRHTWDEPSVFRIVEAIVSNHRTALLNSDEARLPKILKASYDAALQKMRDTATSVPSKKTGDALSEWLKLPKPVIALQVARWIEAKPSQIPEKLSKLVLWLLRDLPFAPANSSTPSSGEDLIEGAPSISVA